MSAIYNPYRDRRPRRLPRQTWWSRPLSPARSLTLFAWEATWLAAVMAAAVLIFK